MSDREKDRIWEAISQLQEEMNQIRYKKPSKFSGSYTPQRTEEQPEKTRQTTLDEFNRNVLKTKQRTLDDFGMTEPATDETTQVTQETQRTAVEMAVDKLPWSNRHWEHWATDIYICYPEMRQFLPDWFIERMQGQQ